MPEAITHLSPEAVIETIEGNLIDASAALGRTDEGVVFRGSDVTWVYTGYPSLSRVLGARFTLEDAEDRIAEILGFFKQWDASVTWVVGPTSFPPRLGDYLYHNGFGHMETWSGLAMDLQLLPAKMERPESLRIQTVNDDAGLEIWASLSPDRESENAAKLFSANNAGSDLRCRYYLGYLNGKAVARCMTFTRDKTMGLYWLNTLPRQRESGIIASAMAHRAMSDARAAGATVAVMATPANGASAYAHLGFKPYCQFHAYSWPPSPLPMAQ